MSFTVSAHSFNKGAGEGLSVCTTSDTAICFTAADFGADENLSGIMISSIPSSVAGSVYYGSRALRAGDVIPSEYLNRISFVPRDGYSAETSLTYLPIYDDTLAADGASLAITVLSTENLPPVSSDSSIATYKNVAITGTLDASDPEGAELTYTLVKEPKRGTVEISGDGRFTYTPKKNKVGSDKFTFTVTDPSGNVSDTATVSVQINKPSTKVTYSDMDGNESYYAALRLADEGIFMGESLGGEYFFLPDKVVTRGEFLAMVINLVGIENGDGVIETGFADDAATPVWVKPYITTALKSGIISGVRNSSGELVFRSDATLTKAEAAVILNNALGLSDADSASEVLADSVPSWAYQAALNLQSYGVYDSLDGASYSMSDPVSRAEAAGYLSNAMDVLENRRASQSLLSWAIK